MDNLFIIGVLSAFLSCNNTGNNANASGGDSVITGKAGAPDTTVVMPVKDTFSLKGQWFLQAVLPSDTAAGRIPFITFNTASNSFTGNTGCNNMNGTFTLTDTSLVLSEKIMLTKMACTGYNEEAFLKNLLRTNRYKVDSAGLILMFNQTELSRWTRKVDRTVKPSKI